VSVGGGWGPMRLCTETPNGPIARGYLSSTRPSINVAVITATRQYAGLQLG
jgi:hypothetical protein